MWSSLPKSKLSVYLRQHLAHAFPDGCGPNARTTILVVAGALDAAEYCFARIAVKYFSREGRPAFNHLNSDQYSMFLYWVSRLAFERGDKIFAEKAYCLNKMMHGLDVFYEVQLPKVFFVCHVIGTVLGRAQYSDYLSVFQGVTNYVYVGDVVEAMLRLPELPVSEPVTYIVADSASMQDFVGAMA